LMLALFIGVGTPVESAEDRLEITKRPLGDEAFQLLKLVYAYDRDIPLEARVVGKQDLSHGTRERIVFRVGDSWVVAYLGIPKSGSSPYPCVLALHGIGGSKEGWWEQDNFSHGGNLTNALLKQEIAVLALDAPYHGERTYSNNFESATIMVFERGWMNRLRNMMVQSVVECRRTIDYLETRADIDASRIGLIGYSLGGIQAFPLTALETRIKVAVTCVTSVTNLDQNGGDPVYAPRNFVRGLGGRSFLMHMGRNDPTCTVEDAKRIFDMIPGSSKELVFYDSGHRLPVEYVTKAAQWLRNGLNQ
jgi:predicted esterase